MNKVDWSKYKGEIKTLHNQGCSSSEILKYLRGKYSSVDFPDSSDRTIRRITKKENGNTKPSNHTISDKKTWKESQEGAEWEFNTTEKPITTLEDALEFCDADLDTYEVERYIFNSWDVSFGDGNKKTNYQVKVWFNRIKQLEIQKPIQKPIKVKPTGETQMWVIIGCVHRPFHNKTLWDVFLQFLKDNSNRIHGIIINGDYLDLRSLSSHDEHIPDGIDLSYEYSDGLQGIQDIESALRVDVRKIFHWGNHEDRFSRDESSIRKYGSVLPSPTDALELKERGWEVNEDWKDGYTLLGNKLEVFHGEYISVNAAKAHLEALPEVSCVFNHTHRFQSYSHNKQTAYNVGWFGDASNDVFKYMMRRSKYKWTNGFAVAHIDGDGQHYVTPIKCDNNKIFFEGKLYKP